MTAAMADHPAAAEMAAEALEALGDVRAAGDGGSDVPVDGGWRPTRPLARPSRARADWNVFVYMAGDDWKEGGLSSVVDEDLREMGRGVAAARLRSTRVRVVAQCDRRGPSVTQRVVFDPDGDGEGRVVAAAPRNLNTGDPANLVDFLRWALQQGPADRTLVVLWGHGSGYDDTDIYASAAAGDDRFLAVLARRKLGFFQTTHRRRVGELLANRGYGFDDSSQDFLDTSDLRRALGEVFRARRHPASAGDGRAPLDALAFDACLMACAEVATELTDVADYLISSQDTEPGDGWPYGESLPALQPCADDEAVRAVVSSLARVYVESYEQRSATTASVLDCAGVVPVQAAVARWVAALNAALGSARTARATRGAWFTAASTARRFPLGRPEAYVDLHDLARLFQEALPEVPGVARTGAAAAQVTAAIGAAVLSSHSWSWPDVDDPRAAPVVPGVGGLSIYCPHAVGSRYGLGRDALRRYRALRFDQHTGWVNALRALGS